VSPFPHKFVAGFVIFETVVEPLGFWSAAGKAVPFLASFLADQARSISVLALGDLTVEGETLPTTA